MVKVHLSQHDAHGLDLSAIHAPDVEFTDSSVTLQPYGRRLLVEADFLEVLGFVGACSL